MAIEISRRLFTADDYQRMGETGILSPGDRVELIRGEVVAMSPIGPPHCASVDRTAQALIIALTGKAIVRVQGAVRLDEYSEPEPDIALLRPRDDFYSSKHPGPADILLIVEVAESSLAYDRTIKAELYAETGIPEYWIIDLKNRCVTVYSDPQQKAYGIVREFRSGDVVTPRLLPDFTIEVATLLP